MYDSQRLVRFVSLLIRAVCGKRIEGISHSNYAGQEWNIIPFQRPGITPAVERFMVKLNARNHVLQLGDRTKNVCALGGVSLHDVEFFRGKRAWLLEDAILDSNLANIMQLSRHAHNLDEVIVLPH